MSGLVNNIFSKNIKTKTRTERAAPQLPQIRTADGSFIRSRFGNLSSDRRTTTPNRLVGTPVDFSHCLGRRDSALCMAAAREGKRTMPRADSEADDQGNNRRFTIAGDNIAQNVSDQQFGGPIVDVDIAPRARALRDEVTNRTFRLGDDIQGDIDALREEIAKVQASDPLSEELGEMQSLLRELESNQNPFIQARVAPFREASERNIARTGRDFSRRGVQGGLAASTIGSIRRQDERAIADQTALATQEAINARRGLIQDMTRGRLSAEQFKEGLLTTRFDQVLARQGALDTVNQRLQSLSMQEFEQELRALNIGQQTVDQILQSQFPETITQRTPNLGQNLGQLLGGTGQLLQGLDKD